MVETPATPTACFPVLFNFRDVGGHTGLDGRTVRHGKLYRSDSLHRLCDDDLSTVTALGLRTVIDLRREHEITRQGRVPPFDGLTYHHIHPEHAEWELTPHRDGEPLDRWLADRYLDLARTGAAGLATALAIIADADAAPAVVHCLAGKDRTGVVCALTLSLLGVADDDIATDYALSTEASARFTRWLRKTHPEARQLPAPYFASPAAAMTLFLTELRARHGSIERYVTDAGLTPAHIHALREHLLH